MTNKPVQFQPVGIIHSCFKEKFGIPRQPGLVRQAKAVLELIPPFDCPEALIELEGFSHVWVIFVFNQMKDKQWSPTVRPPRMGGNKRVGVFASRSPFRPNPIGLSAVVLEKIDCQDGHCQLHLSGVDFLDGTTVLDIKPYLPYADALPDAKGGFAASPPAQQFRVKFSPQADSQCQLFEQEKHPDLRLLIEQILQLDPRPAYVANQKSSQKRQSFGMRLYDFDLKWQVIDEDIIVTDLQPVEDIADP